MPKKEEKHKNEELIGCTVLFKNEADGIIRSATITSVSPSKKFLHVGDMNVWLDPNQVVDTINDPNAPPPEVEEKVEEKPVTIRQDTSEFRTEGKAAKKDKEEPTKAAAKKDEPNKKKKW